MWRSQEERWKSEHVIRKSGIEDLFAEIKFQVGIFSYFTFVKTFSIACISHTPSHPF